MGTAVKIVLMSSGYREREFIYRNVHEKYNLPNESMVEHQKLLKLR